MAHTLYGAPLSPFVSRILIQARAKGLEPNLEMPPGGGLKSEEYLAITPIGKIPALQTDDGVIPESEVIANYIEDVKPEPAMRPSDPMGKAKVATLSRIADLYIGENLAPLFGQMNPKERDDAVVAQRLEGLQTGLKRLDHYIQPGPYAYGDSLTIADCAIATLLFYVTSVIPMFGVANPLERTPDVAAYWDAIQKDEHVSAVFEQMSKAMAERQAS